MTSLHTLPLPKVGVLLTAAVLACALSAAYAAPSQPAGVAPATATTSSPATASAAVPQQTTEAGAQALLARLRQQQPNTRIDSVKPSQLPGLYEVQMGRNVAYVEPGGRYAVFGHMWDLERGQNLTADRQADFERIDPSALPIEMAIRSVHGDGSRVVHVFADPQCGYCRQLERSLPALTNATVYTHLLPVLGDESKTLSAAIWCAADRQKAWDDWMINNRQPAPASPACAGQFAEASVTVQRIAAAAGIQATPTLIAADGRKHAGAMPLSQLEAWLSKAPMASAGSGASDSSARGGQVGSPGSKQVSVMPTGAAAAGPVATRKSVNSATQ